MLPRKKNEDGHNTAEVARFAHPVFNPWHLHVGFRPLQVLKELSFPVLHTNGQGFNG